MQDLTSGTMRSIPDAFLSSNESEIRSAMEPLIARPAQGAILKVGEEVMLKGFPFRVHALTENRVYLDPIATK